MYNTSWQRMCGNNKDPFISNLHSLALVQDLCDELYSIIILMSFVHICLFCKGFCTVYFRYKKKNVVTLPHSAQSKHSFIVKIKEMAKSKKFALESLHQILGKRSTR